MPTTITYEITARVREDISASFETYLIGRHIPDLMETGCFLGASLSRSEGGRYRIRYEARNRDSLERYLRDHASRLREDALGTFPEGVELAREEWEVVATF